MPGRPDQRLRKGGSSLPGADPAEELPQTLLIRSPGVGNGTSTQGRDRGESGTWSEDFRRVPLQLTSAATAVLCVRPAQLKAALISRATSWQGI